MTSVSKTRRRGEIRKTGGSSRSRSRRARRAMGQVASTRRAVAIAATRRTPIDETSLARAVTTASAARSPTSAAGTVTSSPSHSWAVSSWPPGRTATAGQCEGRPATPDHEDPDQADRGDRHRQRPERRQRQGGLRRGALVRGIARRCRAAPFEGAACQAGPNRSSRSRPEPVQVPVEHVDGGRVELRDVDEHRPTVPTRQLEAEQVGIGRGREHGGRVCDRVFIGPAHRDLSKARIPEPDGGRGVPDRERPDDRDPDRRHGLGKDASQQRVRAVDVRVQRVADGRSDRRRAGIGQGDLDHRGIGRVGIRVRDDRTRPSSVDELDLVLETILLAEGHDRRQLRRLGYLEPGHVDHVPGVADEMLDGWRQALPEPIAAGHDAIERIGRTGGQPVDARELDVALDGCRVGRLVRGGRHRPPD